MGRHLHRVAPGHAIRVPPKYELLEFKGFRIPEHLIALTGAGSDTFDGIGGAHIAHFKKFVGLSPDMAILDMGCGVGRDAFQLFDFLSPKGRYIGVDVTRDSIEWCRRNITPRLSNYAFLQFDAFSELYNPFGRQTSIDFAIPVPNGSIDRIVLTSVFTHMLKDEVLH
jgi:SAM-dependent methyltransferase